MSSPAPPSLTSSPRSQRVLGPVDATCVVVGAIIGVGIFFNPSDVARLVGTDGMVLLAWGIGGAIALCGALAFAELGGMYHSSGAQYQILRDSYGSLPAFLFVFCLITIIEPGSIGVMSVICAQNLLVTVGSDSASAGPGGVSLALSLAVALIVLLTLANVIGVRFGARIQNITVFAKVLALLGVTALAMVAAPEQGERTAATTQTAGEAVADSGGFALGGLLAALIPVMFAYGGWQQVLWVAGEVREPRRNLPRAIIIGVVLVVVVYLLANWAYLRLLGADGVAHSTALAADAVGVVFPDVGRRIVAGAVFISAFGVLNAQLLTAPWLITGMAKDGRFFRPFASRSPRFGTPVLSILLLSAVALTMLLAAGAESVDKLVTAVVFVDGIFFALTGIAVLVLRRKRADADRPVRVPGYPLVPLLFAVGELGVVLGAYLNPEMRFMALIGGIWIGIGAVVYFLWFRRSVANPPSDASAD